MKRYIFLMMMFLFLVGCTFPKEDAKENSKDSDSLVKKEITAPDFEMSTFEGNKMKISDFKGKYVVLNFWASWCPPCVEEMPHLQKAYESFLKQGDVVLLGINLTVSRPNEKTEAEKMIKENQYTFPVLLDETGAAAEAYEVVSIPKTVILYPDGIVAGVINGYMEEGQLENIIKQVKEGTVGARSKNSQ